MSEHLPFTKVEDKAKVCINNKTKFNSPLKLTRNSDNTIPIFDRNPLEPLFDNSIKNLKFTIHKNKARDNTGKLTKNYIEFVFNVGSRAIFNSREYSLKKMMLFTDSLHTLSTSAGAGVSAPLEIVLQFETIDKDYLNICILVKPGNKIDKSSSFFNQLFKIDTTKTTVTGSTASENLTFPNTLNLYDILPKNRSYFSYSGPWIQGKCFSKHDMNWIVYENSISIDNNDLSMLTGKLKLGKLGKLNVKGTAKAFTTGPQQNVYYKSDKDATLAGMESGDIKYVKCSKKLMNEDGDAYRKYLYNRKNKNRQCDNILNMNKKLEKKFEQELNEIVGEDTLLGQLNNLLNEKDDYILNILLLLLMFIVLFLLSYMTVFGIVKGVEKIKETSITDLLGESTPSAPSAPELPVADALLNK